VRGDNVDLFDDGRFVGRRIDAMVAEPVDRIVIRAGERTGSMAPCSTPAERRKYSAVKLSSAVII